MNVAWFIISKGLSWAGFCLKPSTNISRTSILGESILILLLTTINIILLLLLLINFRERVQMGEGAEGKIQRESQVDWVRSHKPEITT